MTDLQLEVGKTYKSRSGLIVRIISELEEDTAMWIRGYRFISGGSGQYYTADGRSYVTDTDENPADLIAELTHYEIRVHGIQQQIQRIISSGTIGNQIPKKHYAMNEDLARLTLSSEAGHSISPTEVMHDCSVLAKHAINVIQAAFAYGQASVRSEMKDALKPFAVAADTVEKVYGKDLPDNQRQFPDVTMKDLRYAREIYENASHDKT